MKIYAYVFFLEFYGFSLIFKVFDLCWVNTYCVLFHSFPHEYCFSTIWWRDYSFSIEQSWHTCWKSVDHSLFLDFLFYARFWNQNMWVLYLCSFWRFFDLQSHMNFRISFSISAIKGHWGFDRDYIESADQFGDFCHLNSKSCNPWMWDVFPFI